MSPPAPMGLGRRSFLTSEETFLPRLGQLQELLGQPVPLPCRLLNVPLDLLLLPPTPLHRHPELFLIRPYLGQQVLHPQPLHFLQLPRILPPGLEELLGRSSRKP